MARKQYQSIIRLLQHSGIDIDSAINVSRVKKQLSAEFDFSGSGFIDVDGYEYGKADTFEELEHPGFDERYAYHRRIWDKGAVLDMLENNAFNYFDFDDQLKSFYNDLEFDAFFSPYFSVSFNYLLRSFLNDSNFEDAGYLLLFEGFLLDIDREEAFKPLRIFLDDNLRTLRNVNADNYPGFRSKLAAWRVSYWGNVLNNLPAELYDKKAELAFYLVNITVSIQKSYKDDCKKISHELTCITDLPEDLTNTINSNHKVYTNKTEGTNYGWIIWGAIILIKLLSGC